jgi:hypothetical protein
MEVFVLLFENLLLLLKKELCFIYFLLRHFQLYELPWNFSSQRGSVFRCCYHLQQKIFWKKELWFFLLFYHVGVYIWILTLLLSLLVYNLFDIGDFIKKYYL